jgi:K+-sensing histidine kinase KdpD
VRSSTRSRTAWCPPSRRSSAPPAAATSWRRRLVDNLLDLTRLQAGSADPHADWCALDDLVDAAVRVAAERGTTYVFMGQPHQRGALARVTEWLPERLMRRLPGVDVRIVADPRA